MNEGLLNLGEKEVVGRKEVEGGVFVKSAIRSIRLPSTLKRVEAMTFLNCENLKSIAIPSGVEYIGEACFDGTSTEEITLPSTLREISNDAFKGAGRLRVIWVEGGCTADMRSVANSAVTVLPVAQKEFGSTLSLDFMKQKDVVIPEGV